MLIVIQNYKNLLGPVDVKNEKNWWLYLTYSKFEDSKNRKRKDGALWLIDLFLLNILCNVICWFGWGSYFIISDKTLCLYFRLWLCTFTLSVSAGAVLLLPMSIVSNEVLHLYPKSYYVKWLNSSLIQGMYLVFLFYPYFLNIHFLIPS